MDLFSSYTGTDFLAFYVVMLITCVAVGLWLPANLREEGRRGKVDDLEEAAVLTGGVERYVTAVLSKLFAHGALDSTSRSKMCVVRTDLDVEPPERLILNKVGDFKFNEAKQTLDSEAARVEDDLIRRGLMIAYDDRWKLRLVSTLPYILLFAIGLYRQQAGSAIGEPTGYLIILLGLTAILGVVRFAKLNPRTMAGNEAARDLEERGSRLRRAPSANEAGFAVAIFGTAVLVGTPWEPVHAMHRANAGSGDGGSGGDGDSGGGGCGGGCGGCGG